MATSINWYSVRHHTKISLITVTIIFFLYTVCNLFLVKQFYIRRYIELHLQNNRPTTYGSTTGNGAQHKTFQVDEEVDLATKINLTDLHRNKSSTLSTSTSASASAQAYQSGPLFTLDDDTQVLDDAGFEDGEDQSRSYVRYICFFAISTIVVIEVLYCILYLYVIAQKRFCPMLCFSILSLATFLLHIQRHFTIEQHLTTSPPTTSSTITDLNSTNHNSHESSIFFDHLESLDTEALLNHITYSGWLEIALSASETTLSIFYTILLFYFPGRARTRGVRGFLRLGSAGSRRRASTRENVNGSNVPAAAAIAGDDAAAMEGRPLPNGHATAIELDFIDDDNVAHTNRLNSHSNDSLTDDSSNSNQHNHSNEHVSTPLQLLDNQRST